MVALSLVGVVGIYVVVFAVDSILISLLILVPLGLLSGAFLARRSHDR